MRKGWLVCGSLLPLSSPNTSLPTGKSCEGFKPLFRAYHFCPCPCPHLSPPRPQAILALVSPTAQDQVTQLTLRHSALGHFVTAARLASFVKKGDLVETVAKLAWNACMPFMTKPLLRFVGMRGCRMEIAEPCGRMLSCGMGV